MENRMSKEVTKEEKRKALDKLIEEYPEKKFLKELRKQYE
jgi:hypothetical protein